MMPRSFFSRVKSCYRCSFGTLIGKDNTPAYKPACDECSGGEALATEIATTRDLNDIDDTHVMRRSWFSHLKACSRCAYRIMCAAPYHPLLATDAVTSFLPSSLSLGGAKSGGMLTSRNIRMLAPSATLHHPMMGHEVEEMEDKASNDVKSSCATLSVVLTRSALSSIPYLVLNLDLLQTSSYALCCVTSNQRSVSSLSWW
ncbi:hypothetical protein BDZ90DRAFT_234847 [Jaminaea rosea]|uniref:Uncharacterized protein n=1 Tax=Jaminaea rosea TaxID=1569628 RepID=A0A316UJN6_9BASI|nr:hypothetical protein BDZ90DRAFT_234847 [Jaminaea rosea]PWN24561.1 hypothetical protein BDZ90DRAFT_234847 [Jaminaea rosea]